MRFAAFCLLSAFAFQCSAQEPAHITIFREKSDGNPILAPYQPSFTLTNRGYVYPRYTFQMYLDGTHAATLHVSHFVTFDIPAGHHEIRTNKSERIELDLKPGERVFIRPGLHTNVVKTPSESLEQIKNCEDLSALLAKKTLKPVKPSDVRFGQIAGETSFPTCTEPEQSK